MKGGVIKQYQSGKHGNYCRMFIPEQKQCIEIPEWTSRIKKIKQKGG